MSASQSDLSDARYGYDFVVATTQKSINDTMKGYLYNTSFPAIKMYWNQDSNNNAVPVTYEQLMQQTNNTDPLKVASFKTGDPVTPDITNINNSNFYFAFEAAIGIPPNMPPDQIPDIIKLQEGSQSVVFNLMCAQFTIVIYKSGRHDSVFVNASQPNDALWSFTSIVGLKNIIGNGNLPQDVQDRLNDLGKDAFSVQQLMFDLDNAALESTPQIEGVQSSDPIYALLQEVFLGAYFKVMQAQSAPVLNYAIVKNDQSPVPTSTLVLTSLALEISSYIDPATKKPDTPGLDTLNYVCAINGNILPPSVPFTWNWVGQADSKDFDGVVAIKRINFLNYLNSIFSGSVSMLTIVTNVSMTHSGEGMRSSWSYEDSSGITGQLFTLMPIGPVQAGFFTPVMNYTFAHSSSDDTHDAMHVQKLSGDFNYNLEILVAIGTDTIQIITHAVSYMNFWYGGYDGGKIAEVDGNVIDYTDTVQYEMSTTGDGSLVVSSLKQPFRDNSQDLDVSTWDKVVIGDMVDTMNHIKTSLRSIVENAMNNFDQQIQSSLNGYRGWVFPGGNTFAFKDISFSDSQDLVSHITYVQPY